MTPTCKDSSLSQAASIVGILTFAWAILASMYIYSQRAVRMYNSSAKEAKKLLQRLLELHKEATGPGGHLARPPDQGLNEDTLSSIVNFTQRRNGMIEPSYKLRGIPPESGDATKSGSLVDTLLSPLRSLGWSTALKRWETDLARLEAQERDLMQLVKER